MLAPTVAILGTCDTKLDELLYVRDRLIQQHDVNVKLIDVGRVPSSHPSVSATLADIFPASEWGDGGVASLPRGELISRIIAETIPFVHNMVSEGTIHGMISLGGSGGSSLASGIMHGALPLGFPKLIVSTMAAGDVRPYVGESDVTMMYSVVDIAGLNDILTPILDNAAGAIAGMARAYHSRLASPPASSRGGERIAITMFGVTTPAVMHARALLSAYPCTTYVFHATGSGGRAMEHLMSSGFFHGVLDITTTELADELVGGILSAGPERLTAAARAGIPQIVSLGALDMVNFGPRDTVPDRFRTRNLFEHNPSITLMRTSPQECAQIGRDIGRKLCEAMTPGVTEVWVPKGGLSMLSKEGGPFCDKKADMALIEALRDEIKCSDRNGIVTMVEHERDINDETFVEGMVKRLAVLMDIAPLN